MQDNDCKHEYGNLPCILNVPTTVHLHYEHCIICLAFLLHPKQFVYTVSSIFICDILIRNRTTLSYITFDNYIQYLYLSTWHSKLVKLHLIGIIIIFFRITTFLLIYSDFSRGTQFFIVSKSDIVIPHPHILSISGNESSFFCWENPYMKLWCL